MEAKNPNRTKVNRTKVNRTNQPRQIGIGMYCFSLLNISISLCLPISMPISVPVQVYRSVTTITQMYKPLPSPPYLGA